MQQKPWVRLTVIVVAVLLVLSLALSALSPMLFG